MTHILALRGAISMLKRAIDHTHDLPINTDLCVNHGGCYLCDAVQIMREFLDDVRIEHAYAVAELFK